MNVFKRSLTLLIVSSVLIFTGCEKDDSVKTVDKEEAVQTLEQNSQELETSLQEMEETPGMKAMKTLNALTQKDNPFGAMKKSSGQESVIGSMQRVLKPMTENKLKRWGERKFDFDKWAGTYTWQDTGEWNITLGEPSDSIIIEFPTDTTEKPIENNAVFVLGNYHEFATKDSLNNTVYVADTVQASLTVDGTEVMRVNYTLDYDEENDKVTSLNGNVYLKPFTWELSLSEGSISGSLTNKDNQLVLMVFSFDVTFMDNMEDVKKLEGNFQLHNLNLDGWIEPSDIQNVQDTTFWVEQGWESLDDMVEYVNEQMDVSLYKVDTGNKIADLKVIKKDQEDQSRFEMPVELVLVFKDGSTRPAKEFYQNVITYFKNIMDQYNIQQTDL